jgi:hypothetical protein
VPCGQTSPVFVVQWFVSLVIDRGASLWCAASVREMLGEITGQNEMASDWSTGRLWLLRIGLAALLRSKVIAGDWVGLIDHSIQIGVSVPGPSQPAVEGSLHELGRVGGMQAEDTGVGR